MNWPRLFSACLCLVSVMAVTTSARTQTAPSAAVIREDVPERSNFLASATKHIEIAQGLLQR